MRFPNKTLMIKGMSFVVLITASYSVSAKPLIKEKQEVLNQASSYAKAIACGTTFSKSSDVPRTTLKDVYLVNSQRTFDGKRDFGTKYIVYWSGDAGCAGGSGTYGTYITSFSRYSENRPLTLDKENILDDINEVEYRINDRFIEDVEFYKGVLLITSSDYSKDGTDGGNNFPRYKYRYSVIYDNESDSWKLANRKLLKDNYLNTEENRYDDVVVEEPYI